MKVTVFRNARGRYSLSLPRALAEGMGLQGGEKAVWEVGGRRSLVLRLEEPEERVPPEKALEG